MSSLGYVKQTLAADVANNATVTVSYPSGQSRSTLAGSSSGDLTINDGQGGAWNEGAGGFSLVYGASNITVTNLSGVTWTSGSDLRISFGENAPSGSYEANVNGAGGAAQPARSVQRFTASGAAVPGSDIVIEVDHATVAAAVTLQVVPNTLLIIKNNSASGTAAHTVTLTGGTFDGTTTVATLNAPNKALAVYFDSKGGGTVLANVGTVTLA